MFIVVRPRALVTYGYSACFTKESGLVFTMSMAKETVYNLKVLRRGCISFSLPVNMLGAMMCFPPVHKVAVQTQVIFAYRTMGHHHRAILLAAEITFSRFAVFSATVVNTFPSDVENVSQINVYRQSGYSVRRQSVFRGTIRATHTLRPVVPVVEDYR
jgi:hypothetical protein